MRPNKGKYLRSVFVLSLVLLFGVSAPPAHAATYHVATTGNDADPGTSSQPWKTIGKAATTLAAGDTVFIHAGTYNERVIPQNSGAPGQYITYAAYPGEEVTIDGTGLNVPRYSGLFHMEYLNYIRVSRLRVISSTDLGILADGCTGIIIEGNYTYDTAGSGIMAWGSRDILIDGNEVERACTGIYNECITVGRTDSFEIRNNHVHHAYAKTMKEGICAKDGSSNGKVYGNRVHDTLLGIYVDAQDQHTYNIEVFGNTVYNNGGQGLYYYGGNGIALASEAGGLLENIKVYNNLSHDNYWNGIQVTDCCTATHPMNSIQIVNNTFANNGSGGIAVDNPQASNVLVRNNILSGNSGSQLWRSPADIRIDHNLIDGPTDISGAGYVAGNPLFVNPADGDFSLLSGSPAIDAGSSVDAPGTDYRGVVRRGPGFDIGAYEFAGDNCAAVLAANDLSLHLPIVTHNGSSYWADFSYVPDTADFTVINAGAVADTSPFDGCTHPALSPDFGLHIPAVIFGADSYWADMIYKQGVTFSVTGAGLK